MKNIRLISVLMLFLLHSAFDVLSPFPVVLAQNKNNIASQIGQTASRQISYAIEQFSFEMFHVSSGSHNFNFVEVFLTI